MKQVFVIFGLLFAVALATGQESKPYTNWLVGPSHVTSVNRVFTIHTLGLQDGDGNGLRSERDINFTCDSSNDHCHAPALWRIYLATGVSGPSKCDSYTLVRVLDEKSHPIKLDTTDQIS